MENNRSLTETYAPKRFDEIIGQPIAIGLLKSEIQTGRSVLITGPHGCGKSTIADIYAKGLYCQAGDHAERPCGKCDECEDFEVGRAVDLWKYGRDNLDDVAFARTVVSNSRSDLYGTPAVIIFDQAHRVSDESWDILHHAMSRPAARVTFIVCVEDPNDVRPRTRELLLHIPVKPPGYQDRLTLIEQLTTSAGITASRTVIELLASSTAGSFAKIGHEIEQMIRGGAFDLNAVKQRYFAPTPAEAYVNDVLCGKSFAEQRERLIKWECEAGEKIKSISHYIVRVADPFEPIVPTVVNIDSVVANHRTMFSQLLSKGEASSLKSRALLEEILTVWTLDGGMGDPDLLRRASLFDSLINMDRNNETVEVKLARWGAERKRAVSLKAKSSVAKRSREPRSQVQLYLSTQQVKKLWDRGSFLIQAYGVPLNTRIRFHHAKLRLHDGSRPLEFVTQFGRELRLLIDGSRRRRGIQSTAVHWLYVIRKDDEKDLIDLVAYIPPQLDVQDWLLNRFLVNRASAEPDAVEISQYRKARHNPAQLEGVHDLCRHWTLMRWLVASLDPLEPSSFELLKTLQATRFNRPIGPSKVPYGIRVSRALDRKAREAASSDLSIRSVFEMAAPSDKFCGWEILAHRYRQVCIAKREKVERELKEDYRGNELQLRLQKFREAWAAEKEARDAAFHFVR
jgi:energy-coupling factor transporter ATP-binding protein EcfA2